MRSYRRRYLVMCRTFLVGFALLLTCAVTRGDAVHAESADLQLVPVALELVLAVDTSSSIQGDEFELQVRGYAEAFRDPAVIAAIERLGNNGMVVTLVQWSASFQQLQTVGWTRVYDGASAERFSDLLRQNFRRFQAFGTAIGPAMEFSYKSIMSNRFEGVRKIVDISADETANTGTHPSVIKDRLSGSGITINGLAVADRNRGLTEYFRRFVVMGPDHFVITVRDKRDLSRAIKLKLLREIGGERMARTERDKLRP